MFVCARVPEVRQRAAVDLCCRVRLALSSVVFRVPRERPRVKHVADYFYSRSVRVFPIRTRRSKTMDYRRTKLIQKKKKRTVLYAISFRYFFWAHRRTSSRWCSVFFLYSLFHAEGTILTFSVRQKIAPLYTLSSTLVGFSFFPEKIPPSSRKRAGILLFRNVFLSGDRTRGPALS